MNRLSSAVKNRFKNYGNIYFCLRHQSADVQKKSHESENQKPMEAESQNFGKADIKLSTKFQKKLPSREPLVKNFFIGKVDKELLPFPEVIQHEELSRLQEDIQQIQNTFQTLNMEKVDLTHCIGKEVQDEMKRLNLYGHNIPQHLGGTGYFCTENLMASEPASISADVSNVLCSHSVVTDVLLKFGSDYQKEHILPKLADGSTIATDAIYEIGGSENKFFSTTAVYDDIDKKWIISGEKTFVVNSKTAGLYLVLVETKQLNFSGDIAAGVTVFLVDASSPGVKRDEPVLTLGCKGSDYGVVKFDKVLVSETSIIGEVNGGNEVAHYMLQSQRLRTALLNLGLTKHLINNMTEFCIKQRQGEVFLRDIESIGDQMSKLVCDAYSVESMLYYTAGLIDEFDNPDVALEIAITKLHSLNTLWNTVCTALNFMGPQSLTSGQITEVTLRNAAQLYTQGESRDSLSLFAGLLGLQHAGMNIYETIAKQRNPLFHPSYMLGKLFKQESIDNPKIKWQLNEELHPSLHIPSEWLEHSIARLQMCTETILTRHGTEVIEKHVDVKRISEMVLCIYSMFTSLSRASRSYCIGLRHSDYETLLANNVCYHAKERVKVLATDIFVGPNCNNDRNYSKVVKQLFKSRGYFLEHPTQRNF